MLKSLSVSIAEYLGKNNNSLTKKDLLKIEYTLQVVLGNIIDFIVIFLIFLSLNKVPILLLSYGILISTRFLMGGFIVRLLFHV